MLHNNIQPFFYMQILILFYKRLLYRFIYNRSFERIVPIVYKEPESPEDAAQYRLKKEHVFIVSNTSCLPWIIRLGAKLMDNKDMVDQQVDFFKNRCPTMLPRIHKLYGLYKAIVHEV